MEAVRDQQQASAGAAREPGEGRMRAEGTPYAPHALRSHDLVFGGLVALLSVGMFLVTPLLAVLRKSGTIELGWGWVMLPIGLCVAAVFLHGIVELVRALLSD